MQKFLATLARIAAKSTWIVGYRGVGRIFGPLSRVPWLRKVDGTATISPGRVITFPAFDYYWSGFLWTGKPYEPDVEAIFRRLSHIPDKTLIDCGANIGYWPVKLSERSYGFATIIAVEANPFVYRYLRRNFELNRLRGEPIHAAISDKAGETVRLADTDQHAIAHVGRDGIAVETINLAALFERVDGGRSPVAVVKLDVEGYEIPAFEGAGEPNGLDVIYIYEDWPLSQPTVTEYLLGRGFSILGMSGDALVPVASVEEALRLNKAASSRNHPSNLIACHRPERFFRLG
jgi:FkbM family methyltransferase